MVCQPLQVHLRQQTVVIKWSETLTSPQVVFRLLKACEEAKVGERDKVDIYFPYECIRRSNSWLPMRAQDFVEIYEREYPSCWHIQILNDYAVKCSVGENITVNAIWVYKNPDNGTVNRARLVKLSHSANNCNGSKKKKNDLKAEEKCDDGCKIRMVPIKMKDKEKEETAQPI